MAIAIDVTTSRISRLAEKETVYELLFRFLLPGSYDFDVTRAHKLGDDRSRPGRTGVADVCLVNNVHPLECGAIGEVHLYTDDIRRHHARFFEDGTDVVQRLFYFGVEIAGNLAGGVFAAHTPRCKVCRPRGFRGSRTHPDRAPGGRTTSFSAPTVTAEHSNSHATAPMDVRVDHLQTMKHVDTKKMLFRPWDRTDWRSCQFAGSVA